MLSNEDVKAYLNRNGELGEKGYVELWREEGALGIIVHSCQDIETSPMKIPTEFWTVAAACVEIQNSELQTIKSIVNFYKTGEAGFKLPEKDVRRRFITRFVRACEEHHETLMTKLNNRTGNERFCYSTFHVGGVKKFHNQIREHAINFVKNLNDSRVVISSTGPEQGQALYGYFSSGGK